MGAIARLPDFRFDDSFSATLRSSASQLTLGAAAASMRGVSEVLRPFAAKASFRGGGGDVERPPPDCSLRGEDQGEGRTCWIRAMLRHVEIASGSSRLSISYALFAFRANRTAKALHAIAVSCYTEEENADKRIRSHVKRALDERGSPQEFQGLVDKYGVLLDTDAPDTKPCQDPEELEGCLHEYLARAASAIKKSVEVIKDRRGQSKLEKEKEEAKREEEEAGIRTLLQARQDWIVRKVLCCMYGIVLQQPPDGVAAPPVALYQLIKKSYDVSQLVVVSQDPRYPVLKPSWVRTKNGCYALAVPKVDILLEISLACLKRNLTVPSTLFIQNKSQDSDVPHGLLLKGLYPFHKALSNHEKGSEEEASRDDLVCLGAATGNHSLLLVEANKEGLIRARNWSFRAPELVINTNFFLRYAFRVALPVEVVEEFLKVPPRPGGALKGKAKGGGKNKVEVECEAKEGEEEKTSLSDVGAKKGEGSAGENGKSPAKEGVDVDSSKAIEPDGASEDKEKAKEGTNDVIEDKEGGAAAVKEKAEEEIKEEVEALQCLEVADEECHEWLV